MKIKVYKSLYKPPVIAGISRKAFGSLLMATFMSVAVFRSPEALLPVIVIYFILRWCMKKIIITEYLTKKFTIKRCVYKRLICINREGDFMGKSTGTLSDLVTWLFMTNQGVVINNNGTLQKTFKFFR